jgi:putative toxin-antitoxin system antitoxin component (TIGR02293 family)
MKTFDLFDARISYSSMDDNTILSLIEMVRKGIKYSLFQAFANTIPFSISEWSTFLHVSTRSMQRYQVEQRTFDTLQSEKIVEIAILYKKGTEVFGNPLNFNAWLEAESIALGKVKPKKLLDSSFGIQMVHDELSRIEHGVLA